MSVQGEDAKVTKFVIGDPSHLAIEGSATTIACGPQKTARKIIVEYQPKADRKLGTIGEIRTVQFP